MDEKLRRLKVLTWEGTKRHLTIDEITEVEALITGRDGHQRIAVWSAVYAVWSPSRTGTANTLTLHRVLKKLIVENIDVFESYKRDFTTAPIHTFITTEHMKEAPDGDTT